MRKDMAKLLEAEAEESERHAENEDHGPGIGGSIPRGIQPRCIACGSPSIKSKNSDSSHLIGALRHPR
jgi:hypothetical protein